MSTKIHLTYYAKLLAVAGVSWLLIACSEPAKPENSSDEVVKSQQANPDNVRFQQDVHYKLVENIDAENAKPPFLVEYFWFGCQHCQQFEPVLEAIMLRRPQLSLVRKHAAAVPQWQTDARIFYSLQQMELEHLTAPLFKLYEEKRQLTPLDLQQFLTTHQVDQKTFFDLAENSELVVEKMRRSAREMQDNAIRGVPALVVNGRYLITPNEDINNLDAYLALIDHLQTK